MGLVCELYRVSDTFIHALLENPAQAAAVVEARFEREDSKYRKDNDLNSQMDKAWDIAFFLLKEADPTQKVLANIYGTKFDPTGFESLAYITAAQVTEIDLILSGLTIAQIRQAYNLDKMLEENIYRADAFTLDNWDYIKKHIDAIIAIFKRAAEAKQGIIINFT
jgi:hypothetical protein